MVVHDLECTNPGCSHVESNAILKNGRIPRCPRCRHKRIILYGANIRHDAAVSKRERAVVWFNPKTGSVAYPPVNNVKMYPRYANNGYERLEFTSLSQLDRFCKERKLINEKANFDNSGHADEL